jgi:hypothetical protein
LVALKLKTHLFIIALVLLAVSQPAFSQSKEKAIVAAEQELKAFYESYAEDLRLGRREALGERYDDRGAFNLGNARKAFKSLSETKAHYLGRWSAPKNFTWKDMTIDVLTPESAVVMALFDWQTPTGDPVTYSYTGVLTKRSGKWKIRVEDESRGIPRPPTPTTSPTP